MGFRRAAELTREEGMEMYVLDLEKRVPTFGDHKLFEKIESILTKVLEAFFKPDISIRVETPADGLQFMEVTWGGAHGSRIANNARIYQGAVQASMFHFPEPILAQLKPLIKSWELNAEFTRELAKNGIL